MTFDPFFHESPNALTTLSELRRVHDLVQPKEVVGLFAYATQSGLVAFDLEFGSNFWQTTSQRWLFGVDYGRTQPQAIRKILENANSEVRIYDGEWVISQEGFIPRRTFHAKTALMRGENDASVGAVTGSGNFSANGLKTGVEAGASGFFTHENGLPDSITRAIEAAEGFWAAATPVENIIDEYEAKWSASFFRSIAEDASESQNPGPKDLFWIEAGYVTKNRGPSNPGNQIDLPRGMSEYFGFEVSLELPLNSNIGPITFMTPINGPVTRNLRLGNNAMEKITLPIPETHGLDLYDGKILVFQKIGLSFALNALEAVDFEAAFGDRLSNVRSMGSGRRFGHIE